ncbi:MAG: DUF2284 domain-containing protein [Clostridiales bacterium]|jgi:predicted metal-binding protein|nr:DUF2284 domain-containing protein [Clostridiales bacterium]
MKDTILAIIRDGIWQYGVIPTTEISFEPEVVKACEQNVCGQYDACWTCPPAVGTPEQLSKKIRAYRYALVFTTKHELEDAYDYPGMLQAKTDHEALTRVLHTAVGKACPVFGAGGCGLCDACRYPEPCVNPEKTFPSVEGCGINVTSLSKAAGINYINGENTITYFSMALFN